MGISKLLYSVSNALQQMTSKSPPHDSILGDNNRIVYAKLPEHASERDGALAGQRNSKFKNAWDRLNNALRAGKDMVLEKTGFIKNIKNDLH